MQTRKFGIVAVLTIIAALITTPVAHTNEVESQNNQAKIEVRIQVKDAAGASIGGARVNVWHDTWGPDTGPPDYQEETDSNGEALIRVLSGKTSELSIEVNKGDLWSKGNVKLSGTKVSHSVVLKKLSSAAEERQINVKVHVEEGATPVPGVRVVFRDRLGSPRIVAEGTTGPSGDVEIPVVAWNYGIEASKDGYETGRSEVYLTTSQIGRTVTVPVIKLKKRSGATVSAEVIITVRNSADKTMVNGAKVVLVGKGGVTSSVYSGTTVDGVARIPIKEYGSFDLEITQDYFESLTGEVRVSVGETQKDLPHYFLKEKPKKVEAGNVVSVRVLAGDKKNAPIVGATVTVEKVSVSTDVNGRANVQTQLGEATYVVVTAAADGYKRQTKSVQVRRGVRYTDADASTTIVLEPGEDVASDDTPIRLVVEIVDGLTNQPLPKTNIQIRYKGKIVALEDTNELGEARIEIKDSEALPLSELRTGLKIDADHDNYVRRDSDITPTQLAPSKVPRIVTLHLNRDWTVLQKSITTLEGRVAAWNSDVLLVAAALSSVSKLVNQAGVAESRAKALSDEITLETAQTDFTTGNLSRSSLCRKSEETKQSIVVYETDVAAKAQTVKQLLEKASRTADSCQSPAEANAIKADHSAAIRIVGEIGESAKKARAANQVLASLAVQFNSKSSDRALESRLAEITDLSRFADQSAITVEVDERRSSSLSKGLGVRRDALTGEIETLKKTHGIEKFMAALPADIQKRLSDMSAFLGNKNSDVFAAPDPNAPAKVKATAERIQKIKADAETAVNNFKRTTCEITTMDDRVRNIEGALTTASVELGLHANLPTKASNCTNRVVCNSMVAEIRPLIQQGNVESASAVLTRMDAAGCDTTGLKAELDREMDREAADTINLSQQNCRFQQALDLAAQIPPRIKTKPRTLRAIGEAQGGLQAQKQIAQLIDKAEKTTDIALAKLYVSQARQIAAPYPCLNEMLKGGPTGREQTESTSTPPPVTDLGEEKKKNEEIKTGSGGFWESIDRATTKPTATRRGNNPAPEVEEDPRDNGGTPTTTATKPTRRTNNTATVEEDPRDSSVTNTASNRPARRGNNPAPTVEEDTREGPNVRPPASRRSTSPTRPVNKPAVTVKKQPAEQTGSKTYRLVAISVTRTGQGLIGLINQPESEMFGPDVRSFEIGYDLVDNSSDCPGQRYADHVKGWLDVEIPSTVTIGQDVTMKVTMRGEWSRDCVPPGSFRQISMSATGYTILTGQDETWNDPKAFGLGTNQHSVTNTGTRNDRLFPISYGDGVTVPKFKDVVILTAYGQLWPGAKALNIDVTFIYQGN